MPAKKVKKTKISNVKAEASAVKTVVNVRVGDQYTRKTTKRGGKRTGGGGGGGGGGGRGGGDMGGLGIFNRPIPVSNISISQPSSTNEYNELLRALAAERRDRMAAAPPLAPNTTPLTANEQRNELLNIPDMRTPMTPVVERFSMVQPNLVERELYDDPLSNENMFIGSSRLAERLAPKLPVSNFDYSDIDAYDAEDETEQDALETQAGGKRTSLGEKIAKVALSEFEGGGLTPAQIKTGKVKAIYEKYINMVRDANERYGLNEPVKNLTSFQKSQKKVKDEIDRITKRIESSKV